MTTQHHSGSCQCGAIAFEVDLDLGQTFACNCGRCRRMGFVLCFAPRSAMTITADGPTTEYRFNKHAIAHLFCPTCGVQPFAIANTDGTDMVAVNVNCLDGVDARTLDSRPVDGASF